MFSFLFKYPESSWRQADWVLASGWPLPILLVCLFVLGLAIALSLLNKPLSIFRRGVLWLLQFTFLGLLLTLLWQPMLRDQVVEPGDNGLSILIDTSRSMAYTDADSPRLALVQKGLADADTLAELSDEFDLELLSVATDVSTLTPEMLEDSINAIGESSALGYGLLEVVQSAAARVLSAVVLISDGADTTSLDPSWWQQLTAAQVPVYTVGVGTSELQGDLSIASVDIVDTAAVDAPISARVVVRYGEPGSARLRIFDGEDLLYAETLELPEGATELNHVARMVSGEAGLRDLRFEVEPKSFETNLANNTQRRILSVKPNKRRILYVEGEPRWEFKFIRRALHESPEIELVTLLHTSPNKFYRQGVRSAEELADGFPTDRETLFAYDAIMIGSYEAAKLTQEQQQNIRDFVRIRGGSLMMLAGSSGLSDGGWTRTPLARALPVVMPESGNAYVRERSQVTITELGLETDWLRLDESPSLNREQWRELPLLADFQVSGRPKAGAAVLLEMNANGQQMPLLAWQRYGRGKTYVLASGGTWRWQMGLPSEDQRHELFWQGLLGDLVAAVLPRLSLSTDRSVYYDQSDVELVIDARNEHFEPDSNANLTATVYGPDTEEVVNLRADPSLPGRYQTVIDAAQAGEYRVQVRWSAGENSLDEDLWFLRQDQVAEDYALALNQSFLQRVADETGGEYMPLTALDSLPDRLRQSESRLLREELLPLWNLPIVFLLLALLKLVEWVLRLRWKRL